MNKTQIKQLIDSCSLPDTCKNTKLHETHLAWVIETDNHAFKIKKPIKTGEADFSKLSSRKYFCNREIDLNRRLAPEVYIRVIPIRFEKSNRVSSILDYAVMMKRMERSKRMDHLLKRSRVRTKDISAICRQMARFHKEARTLDTLPDKDKIVAIFSGILEEFEQVKKDLGKDAGSILEKAVGKSTRFVYQYYDLMAERSASGWVKDAHGDLHMENIFLTPKPVIIDCIEFNTEYRHIDVLNDMAFLAMDLDSGGRKKLAEQVYLDYCSHANVEQTEELKKLFQYYKFLRANIMARVQIRKSQALSKKTTQKYYLRKAGRYVKLLDKYMKTKELDEL